ncbi:MAG: HEAT repeat domain-containing protein [Candidatus Thorarchaeota archaeon]
MEQATIPNLVTIRNYSELAKRADEYVKNDDWNGFLEHIQSTSSKGKARDALVALLELEAVGGTDTNMFSEFSSLEGATLHEVRLDGVLRSMEILKEQIAEKHTYFLDVEAMAETPYAILVADVIAARKRELEQLESKPSRIDVLGTFYGFTILMVEGSKPHENTTTGYGYSWRRYRRSTWLDESITDTAAQAVKGLTGQFASEVDMDKRYRTLGSSPIFKSRCTKETANILADAVRLALYKVPGNRSTAARNLGRSGDSRVLPFLHHRFALEQNRRVRISIAGALGNVGHLSSIDSLKEQVKIPQRRLTKDLEATIIAIGRIFSPSCKEVLLDLVENGGNTVKATAIQALGKQEPTGMVNLLTPYLKHKSKPVVRASVLALHELGKDGEREVRTQVSEILKRIGYDRPSRNAVTKMLEIKGVGQMSSVHQYFAKKIEKLRKEADRWKQRTSGGSYSYWYRRREQRTTQRLNELISVVNRYLIPPFQSELLDSVETALKRNANSYNVHRILGTGRLASALKEREPKTVPKKKPEKISFDQTYFA